MHDERMCACNYQYYAILFGILLIIAGGIYLYWHMSSYDYVPCNTQSLYNQVNPLQLLLSFAWTSTLIAAALKNSDKLAVASAVLMALFILSFAMQPSYACWWYP